MSGLSDLTGPDVTDYSEKIAGERRNHDHACRFDVTDGFVGINQYASDDPTRLTDRVLLSPTQFRELLAFLKRARRHRRTVR